MRFIRKWWNSSIRVLWLRLILCNRTKKKLSLANKLVKAVIAKHPDFDELCFLIIKVMNIKWTPFYIYRILSSIKTRRARLICCVVRLKMSVRLIDDQKNKLAVVTEKHHKEFGDFYKDPLNDVLEPATKDTPEVRGINPGVADIAKRFGCDPSELKVTPLVFVDEKLAKRPRLPEVITHPPLPGKEFPMLLTSLNVYLIGEKYHKLRRLTK